MNPALKFSLLLTLGGLALAGCKKDEDTPTPAAPAGSGGTTYTISSVPVFTAKVDGVQTTFKQGEANVTTGTFVYFASNKALFGANYKVSGDSKATVSIGGLTVSGTTPPSDQAFNSFFTTGAKTYAPLMSYNGVDITMTYNDLPYDTQLTPQVGSTFVVTDVLPITDGTGIAKMKVRATFNCKISTGSSTRTLTDGQVVAIFQKTP